MTADTRTRTGPLHGWSGRFAALPDGATVLTEPFVAQADLRVDPTGPAADAVAAHLGVALPIPNTWVRGETTTVIWLGPDEWLVTSPFTTPEALDAGLRAAVGSHGGAVVDVSAQRTTLRLRGEHARDVLATGCSLDLHPSAFPAGSAAQTTVGLAGVVLLALDAGATDRGATDFRLVVRSSFARYLATWLLDAAVEYGGTS